MSYEPKLRFVAKEPDPEIRRAHHRSIIIELALALIAANEPMRLEAIRWLSNLLRPSPRLPKRTAG